MKMSSEGEGKLPFEDAEVGETGEAEEAKEVLQMKAFEDARWRASCALREILESERSSAESKDSAQEAFDSIMRTFKAHEKRFMQHYDLGKRNRKTELRVRRRFKELRRSMDESIPPSSYEEEARSAAAERTIIASQKAADMRLVSRDSKRDLDEVVAAADRLVAQAAALTTS